MYLTMKGEKVYSSKEEALSRLLQPPNSFFSRFGFNIQMFCFIAKAYGGGAIYKIWTSLMGANVFFDNLV